MSEILIFNPQFDAFFDNLMKQIYNQSFKLYNKNFNFIKDYPEWDDLWGYISERSYGNFYKAIIYNAHKLHILKYMDSWSIMTGGMEDSYKEALYNHWKKLLN